MTIDEVRRELSVMGVNLKTEKWFNTTVYVQRDPFYVRVQENAGKYDASIGKTEYDFPMWYWSKPFHAYADDGETIISKVKEYARRKRVSVEQLRLDL